MSASYTWWGEVPDRLRTKTQLADLDLPRIPGAGPAGAIHTRGPHGRKDTFDLYDITASRPSPASAGQLEAARARRDPAQRRCAGCGAHPDYPPTAHRDPGADSGWALLCRACLHIARLRESQQRCAATRERIAAEAAAWLAADHAAVVHVTVITPGPAENGRARRAVALIVDAVTPSGARLVRMPVRLARSRSPLVPDTAIPETEAIPALTELFAGRDVIEWSSGALDPIRAALTDPEAAVRPREWILLEGKVTGWRGDLDPHTRTLLIPPDPGRADLMALLIRRMAADHNPEPAPAPEAAGPREEP